MAIGLPVHDPSWSPGDALPEGAPAADGRSERQPGSSTEGALDLGLVRAVIEDGLLMVFGPDNDPIPPEVFVVAAAEQPHAGIQLQNGQLQNGQLQNGQLQDGQLQDGPRLAAERIAVVLDAQMRGHLGSGRGGGDDAWIEAMLGIGPQPEMAEQEDLLAEDGAVEVIAFGKELLITSPGGATFLVAEARSRGPKSICLRLPHEGPVAVSDLVARLLADPGACRSGGSAASRDEFVAPGCSAWMAGDELVIALPVIGQAHLAPGIGDAGTGGFASVFTSSGDTATLGDLARALGLGPAAFTATGNDQVVTPVAAPPTLSVPLSLALPDAGAARADGVVLVVVRGLPEAATLSAGVGSGDGSWLLSPLHLPGLSLRLPAGLRADLPLEVVAISVAGRDGELTSAADTVVVPLRSDPVGVAPAPIPLGLDPRALIQGGPFDAIIVLDVPAGAALSAGTYDPELDAWVVLPRQLAELCVLPAGGHAQDFTLSVLAVCLQPGSREGPRLLAQVPVTVG
jgi:hypothetical protein